MAQTRSFTHLLKRAPSTGILRAANATAFCSRKSSLLAERGDAERSYRVRLSLCLCMTVFLQAPFYKGTGQISSVIGHLVVLFSGGASKYGYTGRVSGTARVIGISSIPAATFLHIRHESGSGDEANFPEISNSSPFRDAHPVTSKSER